MNTTFSVIVGNIGNVYYGNDKDYAIATYDYYVKESEKKYTRATGENVYLLNNDEIIKEYEGWLNTNV